MTNVFDPETWESAGGSLTLGGHFFHFFSRVGSGSEPFPEPTPGMATRTLPGGSRDPPLATKFSTSDRPRSGSTPSSNHAIAIPETELLTRFPGQDPRGSEAWYRHQKLRTGSSPEGLRNWILEPCSGSRDPYPGMTIPGPGPEVRTRSPGSATAVRDRCRSMLSIEGDADIVKLLRIACMRLTTPRAPAKILCRTCRIIPQSLELPAGIAMPAGSMPPTCGNMRNMGRPQETASFGTFCKKVCLRPH